jgi:hypothetical protein
LLCPHGQEIAMRLADSSRMTILTCLWVDFAKDTGEDGMRHLCLNALGRNSIGCHPLGESGSSAKGRRLVDSDDDADDANEKSTGSSIPVLGVCGNVDNGYTADNGNGSLSRGWFGCEFKVDFH